MPTFRDFLRGLTGPRTEAERVREQARQDVLQARKQGKRPHVRDLEAAGLCAHCEGTGRAYSGHYGDGDCYACQGSGEMKTSVAPMDPEQRKRMTRPSGPSGP